MTTDRLLARVIGMTVCIIAVLATLALLWQVVQHHPVDTSLRELLVLVVGGLLGRLTLNHSNDDPQAVTVQQPAGQPVPVDTTPSDEPTDGSVTPLLDGPQD